ncbi:MAG: hypothetical protein ACRDD8_00905, partial [Bacteroidales bacterium]
DSSLFIGKYFGKGMLLLRNRFFKSCCFNANIQEFFKDNNITEVSQLNGKTLATDISQIKLITTPSSIKYLKFGSFDSYMSQLESTFGIVKYDKGTHFFNGELVQTHYQLLNTLMFSKEETENMLEDSLEYIRLLKQDLSVMRFQLKMNINNDIEVRGLSTTNDFIYTMLQTNDKIRNTSMFSKFRIDMINSYVKNIRSGHILIKGNYSVLMGNGLEMLKSSIGKFEGNSEFGIDEVINMRFKEGEELLGVRSPHITMGNLWMVKNVRNEEYLKYFNLSDQIICINSINNNVLERLNGADFDSDSIMLTNDRILVNKCKENYDKFLVPTSLVESTKAIRLNNDWHRYDLDKKTSVNKIGEIVNLSQVLNSLLWERMKRGEDYGDIYSDICKLAIMSCIEIDRAKKEFVVDNNKELRWLREKYKEDIKEKPSFFFYLPDKMGLYESEDKEDKIKRKDFKHREYDTTMDYLQEIMTRRIRKIRAPKESKITISDLLVGSDVVPLRLADKSQVKRVITMCEKLKSDSALIWMDQTKSQKDKYFESLDLKEKFIEEIKKINFSLYTLKKIMNDTKSNIQRKMLSTLFIAHKEKVSKLIKEEKQSISFIEKDEVNPELFIYGIGFSHKK